MKHRSLLLSFLALLSCITVFSQILELHSVNTTPTTMPLGGMSPPKDGQVVPSTASKAPQMPLEVDGYPVAPPNLQLEQVHIYVRHGAFLMIKGLTVQAVQFIVWLYASCSRGTYAGWCSSS